MKYFEVTVQVKVESEDSKGNVKVKRISELYLVDAMSVTEAEARVVKLFKNCSLDFEVVSVRGSKVLEVINVTEEQESESVRNRVDLVVREKDTDDEE
jgi:hypothetical protein